MVSLNPDNSEQSINSDIINQAEDKSVDSSDGDVLDKLMAGKEVKVNPIDGYVFFLCVFGLILSILCNISLNKIPEDCGLKKIRLTLNIISTIGILLFILGIFRFLCLKNCSSCDISSVSTLYVTNFLLMTLLGCSILIMVGLKDKCVDEFTKKFMIANIVLSVTGLIFHNYYHYVMNK